MDTLLLRKVCLSWSTRRGVSTPVPSELTLPHPPYFYRNVETSVADGMPAIINSKGVRTPVPNPFVSDSAQPLCIRLVRWNPCCVRMIGTINNG